MTGMSNTGKGMQIGISAQSNDFLGVLNLDIVLTSQTQKLTVQLLVVPKLKGVMTISGENPISSIVFLKTHPL